MAKKKYTPKTEQAAPKKVDFKKVSQSVRAVSFEASKDHKGLKKGIVYTVSLNVAEILEAKGLGKKIK